MKSLKFVALFGAFLAVSAAAKADTWTLEPIVGHAPAVWGDKPNWTWSDGNPFKDHGATWTLCLQKDRTPDLKSPYTTMEQGLQWRYNYVWKIGADEKNEKKYYYLESSLYTNPTDATPQSGPASVVRFLPPAPGKYTVDIDAAVHVQAPTAGYAHVTVYTLKSDASAGTALFEADVNDAKVKDQGLADTLSFHKDVTLAKDEELAVRIQTVNPGNGSAGWSCLTFDKFTVKN
jgi:hypothetical protein